ncbi:MAG: hypothetical protein ISR64_02925 [Deltaproteobacteria bacterium]|nr:hypothetical protein [Deltaproteobacteria bacterium]
MKRLAWILVLALAACGGGTNGEDAGPTDPGTDGMPQEEIQAAPSTFYHLEATFWDGSDLVLDRDLSDKNPTTIFAFGSTHIAPAVSLAMTDTLYEPYAIVTLNLGIVVGSTEHPVQCDKAGSYDFGGDTPPAVDLYAGGLQYRSGVSGATGALEVTRWTTLPGDVFVGSFEGRLLFQTGQPDKYVDVKGSFQFTLPEPP